MPSQPDNYDENARAQILKGVNSLADDVKVTLGPKSAMVAPVEERVRELGAEASPEGRHGVTSEISYPVIRDNLGALLTHLADQGYADHVGSWVSDSVANVPVTGEQLLSALPESALAKAAGAAGLSVQEYADQLAEALPVLVDTATPHGELPPEGEFESLVKRFVSIGE
ncbi:YidB family protein [Streptomyces sp. NPDC053079]|uniref:YidB family protein n=1 Tax=Streptomyces sp. NPDC053079 TaxID=3365697 RepID=UPI0037D23637